MARRFSAEKVHLSATRRFDTEDVYVSAARDFDVEEVFVVDDPFLAAKKVYAGDYHLGAKKIYISGYETEPLIIQTLTLQPNETAMIDTYVQEAAPANGAPTTANFSVNGTAGFRRNVLLKFDLSGLVGKTPLTATLYLFNITTSGSNQSFPVHAILAANSGWVEGATWQYANPLTARWAGDVGADAGTDAGCSVAGTDYNATQMGSLEYPANAPANTAHAIALNIAQFAAMIIANRGMMCRRSPSGIFSFHSSTATNPLLRPKLVVTYTD